MRGNTSKEGVVRLLLEQGRGGRHRIGMLFCEIPQLPKFDSIMIVGMKRLKREKFWATCHWPRRDD